ncbi:methyl-accepting chemotaxis protein [Idiomarina tyrosinivorans]|uniref:Methyl-accepting chemotaxis protein n=1 Tax=Idiomarina tyrosinivorans TaxID=1445662 RepID=A0A432ZS76_9GAMM|nr:methyl-accepting chemotaxis protein [Idiomarina tyrosinivorans]RUO80686.1 methyl-accepting chemotaxis protein [Idiomarina tyrosinivorans]
MKITVAMRVIGGFAIITLLLLVISLSSVFNINGIGDSAERLNDKAVPALEEVSRVKVDILELSNIELQAFYDKTQDELDHHKALFEESKTTLNKSLNQLQNLIAGEGQSDNIKAVRQEAEQYMSLVEQLFAKQSTYLSLGNQVSDQLDNLSFGIDDASVKLLDTMDAAQSKDVKSAASNLESSLSSLVTLLYDLRNADKLDKADVIHSEINIALEGIKPELAKLENQSGETAAELVADAASMTRDAISQLEGDGSYPDKVINRLKARRDAQKLLVDSESQLNVVMGLAEKLQDAVRNIAEETRQNVDSTISTGSWVNSIITLISIALAVVISWITVRSISQPLAKVNHMLNIMADGNLTERVNYNAKDEFGELANNTNKLTANLRELINGIANRATQLATAAEQSSTVSVETTSAIEQQRNEIEQVATATQEMNSTSSEMANGAQEALREIQHSDEEASRVREISGKNKKTIEGLASEIENASTVINQLYENSSNIGGILDVIRGIADQTNLLALNAAIEAARAGEQGRGFAVVADEVRTLASRTQESTEEIQQMIESLQTDAQRAVTVMNKGREQAELCVGQSDEAAQALQSITDSVHQAADSSNHIASAAQEQSRTAQDISERLEAIVSIAEQTASGSRQTAEASNEVAKLADELQDSIKSFTV